MPLLPLPQNRNKFHPFFSALDMQTGKKFTVHNTKELILPGRNRTKYNAVLLNRNMSTYETAVDQKNPSILAHNWVIEFTK